MVAPATPLHSVDYLSKAEIISTLHYVFKPAFIVAQEHFKKPLSQLRAPLLTHC
jgi:hypothetical protein